jgi:hypothetical protein
MLNTLQRDFLRKMYGPLTKQEVWRIRNDKESKKLHKTPDLVSDIERKRLEYLKDVISIDRKRLVTIFHKISPKVL